MNQTMQTSERTWDAMCHLSALAMFAGVPFGNIVGPLVVWLIRKDYSASADAHGKEALNFQISLTLYLLIGTGVTAALMLILVGFLMLPFLIIALILAPVVDLIFTIIAAVKASKGELYRYPLTLRLLN